MAPTSSPPKNPDTPICAAGRRRSVGLKVDAWLYPEMTPNFARRPAQCLTQDVSPVPECAITVAAVWQDCFAERPTLEVWAS